MKTVWLAVALAVAAPSVAPQENKGVIEGKVTRPNSSEGIADVQITLQGPSPVSLSVAAISGLYTPNPALTTAMRAEVDNVIAIAPPGTTAEAIARAAATTEARLLGLPLPPAPAQPQPMGAVTDSGGHFSFKGLAPGRYTVRAQREGYFGAAATGAIGIGASTVATATVTVAAGQPTPSVTVEMLRGATMSGRVRDPNGQAISGVQVSAYGVGYQNGRATLQQVNSKTTDDRGEYRLFWLAPGDYYIAAIPRRPAAAPGPQDTYARTFHPGVIDPRSASLVTVAEGGEAAGMDINIRGEATGRISGRVISPYMQPNGQPSQASTFYLLPVDQNAFSDTAVQNYQNMSSNRTGGQFEIRGVLPGSYDLLANVPDGGTPSRQMWGRTRVSVGGGNLEDVTLTIKAGVEVKARVTVDGGAPAYTMQTQAQGRGALSVSVINGVVTQTPVAAAEQVPVPSIRLTLRSKNSVSTPLDSAANQNFVYDPSGMFVFPNVPEGRYVIQANVPATSYIADIRGGGGNAFDEGFDAASLSGPIDVIIKSGALKVQGVVRDVEQRPVASAMVVLVPPQTRRENPVLYKTASTDPSGNFTLNGVAPGEYKVFAWEAVPVNAWMNAEFMARYEGRGHSVTAAVGNAAGVDVRVIPKTLR